MPETCENWLSPVKIWFYFARHTHEIYHVLPHHAYSVDFKAPRSFEIYWVGALKSTE